MGALVARMRILIWLAALLFLAALIVAWMVPGAEASGAPPSKVVGCLSLVSPDVLFCTDSSNRAVMCMTGDKPNCMTMTALYRSWRGHPERRETFMRKLYGAAP